VPGFVSKTNNDFIKKPRTDEFHLSGYGIHIGPGLNITIFNHFFVHGVIWPEEFYNMNDIENYT